MKNLFLVRHAESQHLVGDLTGGWTDAPLTDLGHCQARMVAKCFAEQLLGQSVRVYSSDLQRSRDTAAPIAAALQCDMLLTPELRELNNGVAAGRTKGEATKLRRSPTEPILDWIPFDRGESWRDMHHRIVAFADGLHWDDDSAIILVTHANALICLVNWFLRIVADDLIANVMYDNAPGSITHLRVEAQGCRTIGFLNRVSHLEGASHRCWCL